MNAVMPFGKHAGEDLERIPPAYLRWLLVQPNTRARFPDLARAIEGVLSGADGAPVRSEDTPDHNRLQAAFLVEAVQLGTVAAACAIMGLPYTEVRVHGVEIEEVSDVLIDATRENAGVHYRGLLAVEVKPSIGDDYPLVLRQVKAQRASARISGPIRFAVLCAEFSSAAINLGAARELFKLSGVALLTTDDVKRARPTRRMLERA